MEACVYPRSASDLRFVNPGNFLIVCYHACESPSAHRWQRSVTYFCLKHVLHVVQVCVQVLEAFAEEVVGRIHNGIGRSAATLVFSQCLPQSLQHQATHSMSSNEHLLHAEQCHCSATLVHYARMQVNMHC